MYVHVQAGLLHAIYSGIYQVCIQDRYFLLYFKILAVLDVLNFYVSYQEKGKMKYLTRLISISSRPIDPLQKNVSALYHAYFSPGFCSDTDNVTKLLTLGFTKRSLKNHLKNVFLFMSNSRLYVDTKNLRKTSQWLYVCTNTTQWGAGNK